MKFNNHSNVEGKHAFLSPSKYHWVNYDKNKLDTVYNNHLQMIRGSKLHQLAHDCIKLNVKLPRNKKALNMYVNDVQGFKMEPEITLFYSYNCFGTADAISFHNNKLMIFDLKTGTTKASMMQLLVYTALFCLEYDIKPIDIEIELRIYQTENIEIFSPDPKEVQDIMNKIVQFDKQLNKK